MTYPEPQSLKGAEDLKPGSLILTNYISNLIKKKYILFDAYKRTYITYL